VNLCKVGSMFNAAETIRVCQQLYHSATVLPLEHCGYFPMRLFYILYCINISVFYFYQFKLIKKIY